jgi:hypothetical protein
MMRIVTALAVMTLLLACVGFGQQYGWQHIGIFPPAGLAAGDTIFGGGMHGIAVDPDGKVWLQSYYSMPKDSLLVPNYMLDTAAPYDSLVARKVVVRALHVYNRNGSEVSFSPIFFADVPGGQRDTLGGASVGKGTGGTAPFVWDPVNSPNSGRGLHKAPNGNIYATYFGNVYAFNYKTGACVGKVVGNAANSGTAAAVDSFGYIYFRPVGDGVAPISIFDNNFASVGNANPAVATAFSRTIEVSKNGEEIYDAIFTGFYIRRWYAAGALPPYNVRAIDTLFPGFSTEAMAWDPRGRLWASSGSYASFPNRFPGKATSYDTTAWYVVNPATNTVGTEKINWFFDTPRSTSELPRGIGFSPTGDTAYCIIFGGGAVGRPAGVRAFRRVVLSVEPVGEGVPSLYTLSQNYPNPFNPSTEIQFTIPKSGMTTIKVYDMLGQEVSTLVNEELAPGTYKTRLDGSRLASGTYVYMITSGDFRMSKKMLLLK